MSKYAKYAFVGLQEPIGCNDIENNLKTTKIAKNCRNWLAKDLEHHADY